jgi:hypothetical protein
MTKSPWTYTARRRGYEDAPTPCQESDCTARAAYTLTATHGAKTGSRNYCTNHCAAACHRVGAPFPQARTGNA